MSDDTANGPAQKHRRVPKMEYRFYFGVIFCAALPITCVACLADLVTGHGAKDPVSRALAEARAITPHIFSA
jgi:hypothetical protein